jgi:hypothetical protein
MAPTRRLNDRTRPPIGGVEPVVRGIIERLWRLQPPIALEVVRRIDALFDIEREINGFSAEERFATRSLKSAPIVRALNERMRAERAKLSPHSAVAKAIDYMLTQCLAFSHFLDDGRICLTNNAAERALRGLALGRKSWLFAGSERAAVMYTLTQTAKLNEIDPHAWLADVLSRMAETPQTRLSELLPWNWASDRPSRDRGPRRRVTSFPHAGDAESHSTRPDERRMRPRLKPVLGWAGWCRDT